MAKKQTRRSISVSRMTYERQKAFCETNSISMSQLVETRVNDFLGTSDVAPSVTMTMPAAPALARPMAPSALMAPRAMASSAPSAPASKPVESRPVHVAASPAPASAASPAAAAPSHTAASQPAPMTSAAARFAVEPPLPIIKPRQDTAAPAPAEKRPEQIFTF